MAQFEWNQEGFTLTRILQVQQTMTCIRYNRCHQALPSQLTELTGTCNWYSTHTRLPTLYLVAHYHIRSVLFIALHMEATCKFISLKGLKQCQLGHRLIQPWPSLPHGRHTIHNAKDTYLQSNSLTWLRFVHTSQKGVTNFRHFGSLWLPSSVTH